MATGAAFHAALNAWRQALGDDFARTDPDELAAAATATYATTQRIPAILRPGNRSEVQACVRIAAEHGIPLYPVSTGKNWGYGSRVPVTDGCVLMELARLNRIVDYDERLGYLTVEPGVTFHQAFEYLRSRRSNLLLSGSGGSPEASLLGNTLERGLGTGKYVDRLSAVCGFEVVLANGECIRTGFQRFENAAAGKVYRWGVGPYVDGLFTQSNLGIVTELTVWLQPCPELLQIAFFRIDDESRLAPLVDTLQPLTMQGVLTPGFTVFNDYRLIGSASQYPWDEVGGQTPLPQATRMAMRRSSPFGAPLGAWNGELPFFARSQDEARVHRDLIEVALRPVVDSWTVVEASRSDLLALLERPDAPLPGHPAASGLHFGLMKKHLGVPQRVALTQLYWRKRTPPPADIDPNRDRCGVVWVSPVVPFVSDHIEHAVDLITRVTLAASFEPAITLQCVSERSCILVASLHYDREVPGGDEQAEQWHARLLDELRGAGYHPYRESTLELGAGASTSGEYETFLQTLKRALDPKGILAPGRYIPLAPG